ncbi:MULTISPECIES: Uma2 family endonuclease [Spirulina sp. CCY15215]|uniref:Uma2 family endonuclease n=1 Tax=Spirulina sp. CCY15215 TaxID=2767591 RepID=UPI00195035E5|nr:Uma2 family endonuclease [Spirulina major]
MIVTPTTIPLPDHTQLPCEDDTFVKNFQEHPQSILITTSICPILALLHPDGCYDIGQDCGIYWQVTNPPLKGVVSPDWFYVPNIPPLLNGQMRRSYVLWQERIPPAIVLEFVSGNGVEERDRDEGGKFWVYETQIQAEYYAIYEVRRRRVEVYCLVNGSYQLVTPNKRGHFPIESLGVELGIWQGVYQNRDLPWLRWWDREGNLLLAAEERAEQQALRAERAELGEQQAREQAERLRQLLIENGIDPDAV